MFGGQNITQEYFFPFPDALKENVQPSLSKKTARIIKRLYDSGVLLPRTWGALMELEDEIMKG